MGEQRGTFVIRSIIKINLNKTVLGKILCVFVLNNVDIIFLQDDIILTGNTM